MQSLTTSSGPGRTFGDPFGEEDPANVGRARSESGDEHAWWCSHHQSLGRMHVE